MVKPFAVRCAPSTMSFCSESGASLLRLKNSLKSLMGKELELPDLVWRKLTFAWIGYLLFMGIANIIVFKNFTEAQWVSYKLFGSTALMIVFVIGQGLYLSRYLPRENN